MDKNIQPQDKADLNEKEHWERGIKINSAAKEVDLGKENRKDEDLKPTNPLSENIHTKPADEQMFEDKD